MQELSFSEVLMELNTIVNGSDETFAENLVNGRFKLLYDEMYQILHNHPHLPDEL